MVKILSSKISNFPSPDSADKSGLVAVGGNYHWETLLKAYSKGIFPWFDEKVLLGNRFFNFIYWYSPNPRFVLFKEDFKISRRLNRYYSKHNFRITFNRTFYNVMKACQIVHGLNKDSTWISNDMIEGYKTLHKKGYAMSVEVWDNSKLVGGLYGILIGKYFCGESMFTLKRNASKFAFIELANYLFHKKGFSFIDCQVYSLHLSRFGAVHIPREYFLELLGDAINESK